MSLLQSIPSVWACASGRFDDGITPRGSYLREVERRESLQQLRERKRRAEAELLRSLRRPRHPRMVIAYRQDGSVWQYDDAEDAARCNGLNGASAITEAIRGCFRSGTHAARFCYLGDELQPATHPYRRKPVRVGDESFPSIKEAAEACATTRRRLEEALRRGKLKYIIVGDKPYPSIARFARSYRVTYDVARRWVKLGRIENPRPLRSKPERSFKCQPVVVTKREIEVAA